MILLLPRGAIVTSFSFTGGMGKVLKTALVRSAGSSGFTLRLVMDQGKLEVTCRVPGGDLGDASEVGLWFLE